MLAVIIKRIIGAVGKTAFRIMVAIAVIICVIIPMLALILVNTLGPEANAQNASIVAMSVIVPIIAIAVIIFIGFILRDLIKNLLNPKRRNHYHDN